MLITSSINGGKETRKDILSQNLCPHKGFGGSFSWEQELREKRAFPILFADGIKHKHKAASPRKTSVGRGLDTALLAPKCGTGSPDSDDQGLTTCPPSLPHPRARAASGPPQRRRRGFGSRNCTFMAREGIYSCFKMLTGRRTKGTLLTQHTRPVGLARHRTEVAKPKRTHTRGLVRPDKALDRCPRPGVLPT